MYAIGSGMESSLWHRRGSCKQFCGTCSGSLPQNCVDGPAAFRVLLLLLEVLGQVAVASFQQGVMQGEAAVGAVVHGVSELQAAAGQWSGAGQGRNGLPMMWRSRSACF